MSMRFSGSNAYGFYAYIEGEEFIIGMQRSKNSEVLYRGEYKGDNTPYLDKIKENNIKLYNNIVRYFKDHTRDSENAIMCNTTMTDMEKLSAIFSFNEEEVKKQFPQLYYAILAVLDKEKKIDASEYFNN